MTGIETAAIMSALAATATTAAAGAAVAGGISAYGAGKSQEAQYKQQAVMQQEAGNLEAEKIRERGMRVAATQRALSAKSGVALSGSPAQFIQSTNAMQEYDALLARYGGAVKSNESRFAGKVAASEGKGELLKSFGQAGGSILGGIK